MENEILRKVELMTSDGWKVVRLLDVKEGDTFRLFEPTGEPVVDIKNQSIFIAGVDARINENGIAEVSIIKSEEK